jgi:murein DD-endopeptidase MepM/ murein hydrolase activator NlpD
VAIPLFVKPLAHAVISQGWSAPRQNASGIHASADFPVPVGTPVFAAAAGIVQFAGPSTDGRAGIMIRLEHEGGFATRYLHLSQVLVSAGDRVGSGQQIALSGETDTVGLPHLHLDVKGTPEAARAYLAVFPAPDVPAGGLPGDANGIAIPVEPLIPVDGYSDQARARAALIHLPLFSGRPDVELQQSRAGVVFAIVGMLALAGAGIALVVRRRRTERGAT